MNPRVVVLFLLLSCAHRPQRVLGPDGRPTWAEAVSSHFRVRGDVSAEQLRQVASSLEQIRAALLAARWPGRDPSRPVLVLLAADRRELRDYVPGLTAGITSVDPFGEPLIVASVDEALGEATLLKHELTHVIAQELLHREPRWFSEGMATFLETIDLRPGSAVVGKANTRLSEDLARQGPRAFQFGPLFSADQFVYRGKEKDVELFYDQAWLIFSLLAARHGAGLDAFVTRLERGEQPGAAFAASFPGVSPETLQAEAKQFRPRGSDARTVEFKEESGQVTSRSLGPLDVLLAKAQMRAVGLRVVGSYSDLMEAATRDAWEALQLDPGNPVATAVWLQATIARQERKTELARACSEAHPQDPRSWLLLAETSPEGGERDHAAARAAELAPGDARALLALARVYLRTGRPEEALALAERADRRAHTVEALAALFFAQANAGRCEVLSGTRERLIEQFPEELSAEEHERWRGELQQIIDQCPALAAERQVTIREERRFVAPRLQSCSSPLPHLRAEVSASKVKVRVRDDGGLADVEFQAILTAAEQQGISAWLRSCRFEPGRYDGQPVNSSGVVDLGATAPATK